mmetsp:Transcript_98309/g.303064  ORF Transcript_98309/g.303064 Transcript_98309/m.303064 type:complete len:202 (+) Transcript_98309:226-831(+)
MHDLDFSSLHHKPLSHALSRNLCWRACAVSPGVKCDDAPAASCYTHHRSPQLGRALRLGRWHETFRGAALLEGYRFCALLPRPQLQRHLPRLPSAWHPQPAERAQARKSYGGTAQAQLHPQPGAARGQLLSRPGRVRAAVRAVVPGGRGTPDAARGGRAGGRVDSAPAVAVRGAHVAAVPCLALSPEPALAEGPLGLAPAA